MNLQAVREGIATNLSTISGLRVFSYMPESVEPPTAVVGWPQAWAFHQAMANALDGADDIEVYVFVGRAVDRAAQTVLASYVTASGSTSIRAAIESDATLGGAVSTSLVSRVDGFTNYTVGGTDYLGCKFHVKVYG